MFIWWQVKYCRLKINDNFGKFVGQMKAFVGKYISNLLARAIELKFFLALLVRVPKSHTALYGEILQSMSSQAVVKPH
jgi:hypothetical protein